MVGLTHIDFKNRNCEFGQFLIDENYQKKGMEK